ncbi:MAG TPA: DUF2970 domain-containing protein [Burkholderiaceae bacterium]|nr:DUF2970 domain-containing protein [Burkholderiaceae bacterium]
MADEPVGGPPKAGIVATVAAVAASFFGVRGRGAHERDMSTLNPVAVIATGVALAAAFVAVLVLIVKWVVA